MELVLLDATPWYHCIARCVRRAFLCGQDSVTGRNFEHRRGWIVQRIRRLAAVFAIDIAAYAVMSNHFHLVLRVDSDRADDWSRDAVIDRWCILFAAPPLIERFRAGDSLSAAQMAAVDALVDSWRERLADISWFMRCLNEYIARLANAEDGCTGRFWEGRFRCQALLDDTAVLSCMAYVDLNPIRAGIADTPEASDFTSIQERLGVAVRSPHSPRTDSGGSRPTPRSRPTDLLPFAPRPGGHTSQTAIPFALADYVELIEWTGRTIRNDKRGSIPGNTPPILQRLAVDPAAWLETTTSLETRFPTAIGCEAALSSLCHRLKRRWLHGIRACRELYRPALVAT
jgi:REP element-mobilizing transposase RayT